MHFDLFLSHNNNEKDIVSRAAARMLDEFSVRCWLDEWDLAAGTEWETAIDSALRQCRAAAVFLGPSGWGDAHMREARAALERAQANPEFLVIPVLLPGAAPEAMAVLGDFFSRKHRIELTDDDALRRLVLAVRGEAHGPPVMTAFVIRRDAQRWYVSNGDRSLLYRGAALQEAQRMAIQGSGDFDDASFRFLAASAQKEKQRTRGIIGSLTAIAVALTAVTVFALVQRQIAKRETARALVNQRVAEEQRRVADARRREVTAQMQRASTANLMELGQRLYEDEPRTALRLAAEALARAPSGDKALAQRVLSSVRDMVSSGRLARVAVSAEKPIAVGDTDLFVINESAGSTLRRRFDGSVVTRLPLKVENVISDETAPPAERVPYFLLKYGDQQQELRRKRDGSVVTQYSVDSAVRATPSFVLIKYFGGETELRRDDRDTVPLPLAATEPKVTPIEGSQCFAVTYPSAVIELRSSLNGKTIGTLPGFLSIETSGDQRMFAIAYSEKSLAYEGGGTLASGNRVALFDSHCGRVPLPERAAAVIFDRQSSRYVAAYHGRDGEIRSTGSSEVTSLPAPVDDAVFIGERLFVTYQNSITQMRSYDGRVLAAWPNVLRVDAVPGTKRALVTLLDDTRDLVDLETGEQQAVDVKGWIDTRETPSDAGPLQYFVMTQNTGQGIVYEIHSA